MRVLGLLLSTVLLASSGEAVRRLDVPVGRVLASPFCRTLETAQLAFGDVGTADALLALASVGDEGSPDRERTLEAARALAAEVPQGGTNTVLVGHVSTFEPLASTAPEEGGTVVLAPDGDGGFEVVGEVPPGGWALLPR
jgi:phosphohistidine phosphatase SixA